MGKRAKRNFTVSADGHYIGSDGFVVPRNFAEFNERFPGYVLTWVKRNLRGKFSKRKEDQMDWASELNLHLMTLPDNSSKRANGHTDVISCFDPLRNDGATESKFFYFVDFCLKNKFRRMRTYGMLDALRDTLRGEKNMTISTPDETGDKFTNDNSAEDIVYIHSQELRLRTYEMFEHEESKTFVSEFRDFVAQHEPGLVMVMDAIATAITLTQARKQLGKTAREFNTDRSRLEVLRECWETGKTVPKRRKPYNLSRDLKKAA